MSKEWKADCETKPITMADIDNAIRLDREQFAMKQPTLAEMRRVVAQYCTCGRCIFFETLGGGRCLNAGISEFTTGEEFSPPDEFSCCNWIENNG